MNLMIWQGRTICLIFVILAVLGVFMTAHSLSDSSGFDGKVSKNGGRRIPTLNKMGDMLLYLDGFTQAFLDQSDAKRGPVLDIGSAYGFVVKKALWQGLQVVAIDIEPKHLQSLKESISASDWKRLSVIAKKFPDDISFEPHTFQNILISRVFNFLDDKQVQSGAQKLFQWLKPGGRVFVTAETPYLKAWSSFASVFERRKKLGVEAPGLLTDTTLFSPSRSPHLPEILNFFDPDTLIKPFLEAGFQIEKCHFISRPEYPEALRYDGRESVGLIAVKS